MSRMRSSAGVLAFCAILSLIALAASACQSPPASQANPTEPHQVRQALLDELRPVTLKNCRLKRFGSVNDGGYLMCENLIAGLESAYSYGIDTEDNWGCEVSREFGVRVHQYDCFTPHRPMCEGAPPVFHNECIGVKTESVDSRPFDTLTNQIARNGDRGRRLIVKMDVEGAEWDSLLATPDAVLNRIDQMPMELHGVHEPRFLELVRKLKRTFYLVSLHFNNHACSAGADPLPAWAYQVLFVNKRLGVPDPSVPGRVPGSPPDAPDDPSAPDCQVPNWERRSG
jgi:hypothetical protein